MRVVELADWDPDVRVIDCRRCGRQMQVVDPSWPAQEKLCNNCVLAEVARDSS